MTKMTAKFNGSCSVCGRTLLVGSAIAFFGKGDARCLACAPEAIAPVAAPVAQPVYGVARGVAVRVVRGRKLPLGLTGTVVWMGETQYGTRVGIKVGEGDVRFTAATNVARLS